jgi:hypothetical protein
MSKTFKVQLLQKEESTPKASIKSTGVHANISLIPESPERH